MRSTIATVLAVALSALLAACGSGAGGTGGGPGGAPAPTPALAPADAAPERVVMVIRHAEKPDGELPGYDAQGREDDSSLTEVGWERARLLADLFDPAQGSPPPGIVTPAVIYAAGATDEGEGQRTRETVAPLAERLGIAVDTTYGRGQEEELVEKVVDEQGPTLISWQHSGITEIADAFPRVRPKPPSEWPSDRFDVIWTFTETADGWRFDQVPERLLPGDPADVIEK